MGLSICGVASLLPGATFWQHAAFDVPIANDSNATNRRAGVRDAGPSVVSALARRIVRYFRLPFTLKFAEQLTKPAAIPSFVGRIAAPS